MAQQFINPATILDQTLLAEQPTQSYAALSKHPYQQQGAADYEEHLPTCPSMGAVTIYSADLPDVDSLPEGWWYAPQSTHYVHYNRTDLY